MKNMPIRHSLRALAAGALALLGASAFAASTWDFGGCTAQTGGVAFGNSYSCTGTNGAPSVTAYAWGSKDSVTGFQAAYLSQWGAGSGFGVASQSEAAAAGGINNVSSPNHAMDNNPAAPTVPDLIALKFDSAVSLNTVTLGWSQSDADFTLLAYTGAGAPAIQGKTASTLATGWALVQNSGDGAPDAASAASSTDIVRSVNGGNVSSSWWLISAYDAGFGGGTLDTLADYVKVLSVAGTVTTTTSKVPEPSSLALVAVALLAVRQIRMRKQQTSR